MAETTLNHSPCCRTGADWEHQFGDEHHTEDGQQRDGQEGDDTRLRRVKSA
jgi:hypothetical protein